MSINSPTIITGIGVTVILVAIGISTAYEPNSDVFQVISVGPVWNTDSWVCTSDSDFIINGALRGVGGALVEINISNIGAQSLYALEDGRLETFTVGVDGGNYITITKTGILSGFITMQTESNAQANCSPL